MEEARTSARNPLARKNHSNGAPKIAFVSKKSGAFHLIANAAKAPELFAVHLIRTRTAISDYKLFFSCPNAVQKNTCSRTSSILKEYKKTNLLDSRPSLNGDFSPRQAEVSWLVGEGLRNKEIAERLCITVRTVKHHMNKIFQKLGMDNRMQLLMFMRGKGRE